MPRIISTEARANLHKLIDAVSASHEPVRIIGKRGNAIFLAEDDWNAINAALHFISIPKMREFIRRGVRKILTGRLQK